MDRRGLILGLGALAVAGPASAQAKPPVKLAKAFPFLDRYYALPPGERDRFAMSYAFRLDGKPATNLKGWIVQPDGRREPLMIAADGRVTRLPTSAELASAMLALEVPAGAKTGVKLDLVPSAAPAREMNPRDLEAAIAQANAGMAKAAGLMSFAAPKVNAVGFPGAGGGEAVLGDGRRAALPIVQGEPAYAPAKLAGAQKLVFTRPPARLVFLDKI